MPFQTLSATNIEANFNETLKKELDKHKIKTDSNISDNNAAKLPLKDSREELIAKIPDKDRRKQFLLVLKTINRFKVYPSNIPKVRKQELLTAALLDVKKQIYLKYDASVLKKFGLGILGFSDPNNSLLYSDIDYIIGVTDTNTLDEQCIKLFEHLYKKYKYMEEWEITEPYFAAKKSNFLKEIKIAAKHLMKGTALNETMDSLSEAIKQKYLKKADTVEKGTNIREKKLMRNYLSVKNNEPLTMLNLDHPLYGTLPKNYTITEKSNHDHYLSRKKRTLTYQKRIPVQDPNTIGPLLDKNGQEYVFIHDGIKGHIHKYLVSPMKNPSEAGSKITSQYPVQNASGLSLHSNGKEYSYDAGKLYELQEKLGTYMSELAAYNAHTQTSIKLMNLIRQGKTLSPLKTREVPHEEIRSQEAILEDPKKTFLTSTRMTYLEKSRNSKTGAIIYKKPEKGIKENAPQSPIIFAKLSTPTNDNAKNILIEDDSRHAAKSHYFKNAHRSILTFQKTDLKKLPEDTVTKQKQLEKKRLGRN